MRSYRKKLLLITLPFFLIACGKEVHKSEPDFYSEEFHFKYYYEFGLDRPGLWKSGCHVDFDNPEEYESVNSYFFNANQLAVNLAEGPSCDELISNNFVGNYQITKKTRLKNGLQVFQMDIDSNKPPYKIIGYFTVSEDKSQIFISNDFNKKESEVRLEVDFPLTFYACDLNGVC